MAKDKPRHRTSLEAVRQDDRTDRLRSMVESYTRGSRHRVARLPSSQLPAVRRPLPAVCRPGSEAFAAGLVSTIPHHTSSKLELLAWGFVAGIQRHWRIMPRWTHIVGMV
jgi:hypothetical protein